MRCARAAPGVARQALLGERERLAAGVRQVHVDGPLRAAGLEERRQEGAAAAADVEDAEGAAGLGVVVDRAEEALGWGLWEIGRAHV